MNYTAEKSLRRQYARGAAVTELARRQTHCHHCSRFMNYSRKVLAQAICARCGSDGIRPKADSLLENHELFSRKVLAQAICARCGSDGIRPKADSLSENHELYSRKVHAKAICARCGSDGIRPKADSLSENHELRQESPCDGSICDVRQ